MATVIPFRGLRYARRLRPQLARLVTPPYDIISPRQQERFYRAHPNNIIRLELGRTGPKDTGCDNRYTRARDTLAAWLEAGVLAREARPVFYLLRTRYLDPDGEVRTFTGLIGRVRLEPLGAGSILPHEHTFRGPKQDRYDLLAATGVSFSPVFALYRQAEDLSATVARLTRRPAGVRLTDWSGTRHELWSVQGEAAVRALSAGFRRRQLLIADGHHRYSTALNFQARRRGQAGPDADHVMMCLADSADPGLTVWPVCRQLSGLPAAVWRRAVPALEKHFRWERVGSVQGLRPAQRAAMAGGRVVLASLGYPGRGPGLLHLRSEHPADLFTRDLPGASAALRGLDVVVLDHLVLKRLLGIPPGDEAGRVAFTKDLREARRNVVRGGTQAAFVPGPPRLDEIWRIAEGGETMPQKSTYFLPKLITGLVMNPIGPTPPSD